MAAAQSILHKSVKHNLVYSGVAERCFVPSEDVSAKTRKKRVCTVCIAEKLSIKQKKLVLTEHSPLTSSSVSRRPLDSGRFSAHSIVLPRTNDSCHLLRSAHRNTKKRASPWPAHSCACAKSRPWSHVGPAEFSAFFDPNGLNMNDARPPIGGAPFQVARWARNIFRPGEEGRRSEWVGE
jgi:hypothetical protein